MIELGFSKREMRGVFFLVFILFVVIFSSWMMTHRRQSFDREFAMEVVDSILRMDSLAIMERLSILEGSDPNLVSLDTLMSAGFSKDVGLRLIKFRESGFHFSDSYDLLKVYGIDSVLCRMSAALWHFKPLSYISKVKPSNRFDLVKDTERYQSRINLDHPVDIGFSKPVSSQNVIELNLATPESLLPLFGIGPVLSKRIVKFRNLLGGFFTVQQMKEVYGLRATLVDSLSIYLSVDSSLIKRIDLRNSNYSELIRHPYIDKSLVVFLLDYRAISDTMSIESYANKKNFDIIKIKKIAFYVKFN